MAVLLAALSAAASAFFYRQGSLLWHGDAMAHLNIARRIIDSRTPGWEQIGTVWLPLPHLLMLPLVREDFLWQTGLAGSIASGFCFVIGGLFLFLAARRAFSSGAAGLTACLLVALNPNLLFMQSIAMTEAVFLMALAAALYFTVRFRETQSLWCVAAAGTAVLAATLTRYEGWFLIPFATLYFLLAGERRWTAAILFGAIASLGPLWWLGHNLWYYGDPLEFYHGPYSAKAIYQRALYAGLARYPGDHEWGKAVLYYRTAVQLTAGWMLLWLAAAGAIAACVRKVFWPLALLALPPAFYVLSLYSSGTPIFVPTLWPHTHYNTRYGLAALPLLAMAAAGLVALAPQRFRGLAAVLVVAAGTAGWAFYPRPDNWVCWKEAQANNAVRMAWTHEAAQYLKANLRPGDEVFTSFGAPLIAIFQEAGIPLRRTLHTGNGPLWLATVQRPDLFLWEEWAVAESGDEVSTAILRARKTGPRYDCVKTISLKGAPVIEIYRRSP